MKRSPFSRLSVLVACTVAFALCMPSTAWATVEEDQSPASEEDIAGALEDGDILSVDPSNEMPLLSEPNATLLASGKFKTIAGATRVETAALQAQYAYPDGAKGVIIAGTAAWPDALAATSLAGALGYPILYTEKDSLPSGTADAIKGLKGVTHAIVLGDGATVGSGVEAALKKCGITKVERLAGADRYKTQVAIYNYGKDRKLWSSDWVVVASGSNFPDALSISPFAACKKVPIFLANELGNLSVEQETILTASAVNSTFVIGSNASVSDYTMGFMEAVTTVNGAKTVERLGGEDRYKTSLIVASRLTSLGYLSWSKPSLASGEVPYDALAGSVVQGKDASVVLLAGKGRDDIAAAVKANASSISLLKVFGSKASVPMTIQMQSADALGVPFSQIKGIKVYIDAGHGPNGTNTGAYDSGAVGSGYQEATLNKELADSVGSILKSKYGMDVYVNTKGGYYKYRHAEAVALGCDLIVSIHFNAGGGTGTESLIHSYNANSYSAGLQNKVHPKLVSALGLPDRGKKKQEVAVIGGQLPAVLLEICFIDNGKDMSTYQGKKSQVAAKIAEGIAG